MVLSTAQRTMGSRHFQETEIPFGGQREDDRDSSADRAEEAIQDETIPTLATHTVCVGLLFWLLLMEFRLLFGSYREF